jgi:DNA-binding winged helix-turn-helix (wHTH) protein
MPLVFRLCCGPKALRKWWLWARTWGNKLLFSFENYVLDSDRRELRHCASLIAVEPQVFDLLELLIRNRHRVVSKDDLLATIWRGRVVSESTVSNRINAARTAIGDRGEDQRLIKTLPRKGLRFVGDVRELEGACESATIAPAQPESAAPLSWGTPLRERRQLTVVSCELLMPDGNGRMDPEDLSDLIGAYHRCIGEMVGRFNGFVGHSVGKTVLVYFGYPVVHENDAEQAVHCGLELCAALERMIWPRRGMRLQGRVGIATGPALIDSDGSKAQVHTLVGEALSIASCLHGAARTGTVLIDTDTRRLIGGFFDCHRLDSIFPSGAAGSLETWLVRGRSTIESRFEALHPHTLSPLIGRDEETELLLRRWTQATTGRGRVVLLSGEPGIGKSRLVAALQDRLAAEPNVTLRYFCSPASHDSALLPITAHIERAAGLEVREGTETKIGKLEALLGPSRTSEEMAILLDLLAIAATDRYPRIELTPQRRREKTFDLLLRRIESLAARQPILMVFEDLHWIDPTSLELLDRVIELIAGLPVLLVMTFRPEFATLPYWTGSPQVTTLVLSRLDRHQGAALVEQIEGGAGLPSEVVKQIVERTDGVPLFIEEMTKAVLESRGLDLHLATTIPSPTHSIPTSLQNSLMARLDRLGHGRTVAQIGATIGRRFSFELISALALLPDEALRLGLQELVDAQLVFCRGTPPNVEYTFKHALVQDIAYESMLKGRRVQIHQGIAEAIQLHAGAIAQTQPELVARHLTEAELWPDAIFWWSKAGDQSLRRSAFVEAVGQFEMAISLLKEQAPNSVSIVDRLRIQIAYGQAMISAKGHSAPETTRAFTFARELAAEIEDSAERYSVYYGLWVGSYLRGESRSMLEFARFFSEDVSRQPRLSAEACVAHRICGVTSWWHGDGKAARKHFDQAVAAYDVGREHASAHRFGQDIGVCASMYLAMILFALGEIPRSLEQAEQAMERALQSEHIPTIAWAHCHRCLFDAGRRDVASVTHHSNSLLSIANEHNLPLWKAYGTFFRGLCGWESQKTVDGLVEMQTGIDLLRNQGVVAFVSFLRALQARSEAEAGNFPSARTILDDIKAESQQTGDKHHEIEIDRYREEILAMRTTAVSSA